ncbi:MAG: metal-sulfur cluster assembly factor [Sporichthyaceae bacterium]
MSEPLRTQIEQRLDAIADPCSVAAGSPIGLAEMGLVRAIDITAGGHVTVHLRLTSPFCHMIGFFTHEATRLIGELPGVTEVTLRADQGLDWSPSMISPTANARRRLPLAAAAPRS